MEVVLDPRIKNALISVNPTTQNPNWHGAPTTAGVLRGINARVAVWRPYPGANNIREIALHLAFYENSVANRLTGESVRVPFMQRKSGWAMMLDSIDEEQWKAEMVFIKEAHNRLTAAVTGFDPAKLDLPVTKNTTWTALGIIHGVAEHSLHHSTQIEMLKTFASHQGIE